MSRRAIGRGGDPYHATPRVPRAQPPQFSPMKFGKQQRPPDERTPAGRSTGSTRDSRGGGGMHGARRGAGVYVFSQDRSLQLARVHSPRGEHMLLSPDPEEILEAKRRVLATGQPEDAEAFYTMEEGPVLFSFHIDPTFAADGTVDGIMCAAIDVTRIRSLESEQQRLSAELGATVQRYETALRGSNVTVFTQDRSLRYTSISNALFGRDVKEIVG